MTDCVFVPAEGGGVVCENCGTKRAQPSRRNCRKPAPQRELSALGKVLLDVQPGDRVAEIAKLTGGALIAEAWEKFTGRPCGCGDRQKWLNSRWAKFVRERFAIPAGSTETSRKSTQRQQFPQPSGAPAD